MVISIFFWGNIPEIYRWVKGGRKTTTRRNEIFGGMLFKRENVAVSLFRHGHLEILGESYLFVLSMMSMVKVCGAGEGLESGLSAWFRCE